MLVKNKTIASGPVTSQPMEGEKAETVTNFIFLGSKITVDSNCSNEIKRHFLLGRKAMTNLDSTLKSRDITLLTKASIVKSCGFSNSHVLECEIKWALGSITMNKASRDDKNSS